MSAVNLDLQDLLQNADQLFDENQYQEVIDILKKYPVSIYYIYIYIPVSVGFLLSL